VRRELKNKKQIRRDLFAESSICPSCGRAMVLKYRTNKPPSNLATIDHITPLVAGGSNERSNLILICWRCNNEKDGLMPEEHKAKVEAENSNEALSLSADGGIENKIAKYHVFLAVRMAQAMGMDPNAKVVEGDETLNWQFLLPAAACAFGIMEPMIPPEGDMLAVPDPNGGGFLLRIDEEGQLHIREDIDPGTPLFTLINKRGDVTVAIGPSPTPSPANKQENESGSDDS